MNNQGTPKFWIYAKRKHSNDVQASLYVKIVFNKDSHERSMGVRCPYESWQKEKMTIAGLPLETFNLKKAVDQLTQKVMGAYYLLNQQDADFTLAEILEVSNGDRKPGPSKYLSLSVAFSAVLFCGIMSKYRSTLLPWPVILDCD